MHLFKVPDSHQTDPVLRLKVDVKKLVMEPKLTRRLDIPKVISGQKMLLVFCNDLFPD